MPEEDTQKLDRFDPLIASAERILSERFDTPVRLGETVLLSDEGRRNALLRCRNLSGSGPESFILKQVVTKNWDPEDSESWDIQRFFKDWSGVQFLSDMLAEPAICPRFYGGDRALGFFIIEDLGTHRSLVEPLLEGSADTATIALLTYARTLGRMHAASIGQEERFRSLLHALNGPLAAKKPDSDFAAYAAKVEAMFTAAGIAAESGLADDLRSVREEVENPGPFHAYIHGDPCPDNVFFIGDRMVLIDFEFGRFGHALHDALYGRMPFPTCWCCNRLPAAVVEEMESAYRAELATCCPEAQEERLFQSALENVCANWTLEALDWHLENTLKEDGQWGIASVRPRVLSRLDTFIALSGQQSQLPVLRSMLSRLRDSLQRQWPETESLPLYPAFRPAPGS